MGEVEMNIDAYLYMALADNVWRGLISGRFNPGDWSPVPLSVEDWLSSRGNMDAVLN
jgi:hypothetical protein